MGDKFLKEDPRNFDEVTVDRSTTFPVIFNAKELNDARLVISPTSKDPYVKMETVDHVEAKVKKEIDGQSDAATMKSSHNIKTENLDSEDSDYSPAIESAITVEHDFTACDEQDATANATGSRWFVNCLICNQSVLYSKTHMKCHSLTHLKEDVEMSLFECIPCQADEQQWHTLYKTILVRHLKKKHDILHPEVDRHYLDKTELYSAQIDIATEECFSGVVKYKKAYNLAPYPMKKLPSGKIECKKCRKTFSCNKQKHVLFHLNAEKGVVWYYKCKLCSKKHPFRTLFLENMSDHLRSGVHRCNGTLTLGEHYVSRDNEFEEEFKKLKQECFEKSVRRKRRISNEARLHKTVVRLQQAQNESKNGDVDDSDEFVIKANVQRKRASGKCSKCLQSFERRAFQSHCLKHLMEEEKIGWPYECLSCSNGAYISEASLKCHAFSHHEIKTPKPGVDYLDRTSLWTEIIADAVETYFGAHQSTSMCNSVATDAIVSFRRKVACTLCLTEIRDKKYQLRQHCLKHLKDELGIQWLFCCKVCINRNPLKNVCVIRMRAHLSSIHKITCAVPFVHYDDVSEENHDKIEELTKKCFPTASFRK